MDAKLFEQLSEFIDEIDEFPMLKTHQRKQQPTLIERQVKEYDQKIKTIIEQYNIARQNNQPIQDDLLAELQITNFANKNEAQLFDDIIDKSTQQKTNINNGKKQWEKDIDDLFSISKPTLQIEEQQNTQTNKNPFETEEQ